MIFRIFVCIVFLIAFSFLIAGRIWDDKRVCSFMRSVMLSLLSACFLFITFPVFVKDIAEIAKFSKNIPKTVCFDSSIVIITLLSDAFYSLSLLILGVLIPASLTARMKKKFVCREVGCFAGVFIVTVFLLSLLSLSLKSSYGISLKEFYLCYYIKTIPSVFTNIIHTCIMAGFPCAIIYAIRKLFRF